MTKDMGAIDRRKHDIDVMERVLGTAREPLDGDAYTEVVDLGIRPWLAGTTMTAVQVTVGTAREDEKPGPARDDDQYESDRRGEHTYPPDDTPEPKSHRERDELRSRLERRG